MGIFNIVDDLPAPLRDWLPIYAAALDAPRPRKVPSSWRDLRSAATASTS